MIASVYRVVISTLRDGPVYATPEALIAEANTLKDELKEMPFPESPGTNLHSWNLFDGTHSLTGFTPEDAVTLFGPDGSGGYIHGGPLDAVSFNDFSHAARSELGGKVTMQIGLAKVKIVFEGGMLEPICLHHLHTWNGPNITQPEVSSASCFKSSLSGTPESDEDEMYDYAPPSRISYGPKAEIVFTVEEWDRFKNRTIGQTGIIRDRRAMSGRYLDETSTARFVTSGLVTAPCCSIS